jgi:hypothetical protein
MRYDQRRNRGERNFAPAAQLAAASVDLYDEGDREMEPDAVSVDLAEDVARHEVRHLTDVGESVKVRFRQDAKIGEGENRLGRVAGASARLQPAAD